jgi:alkylhydroperoxidase family enzyme
VPQEQLDALPAYRESPLFSDLERLVIRYAEEMTIRVQVDATLVEALKKHLTPEALVQLTLSIAAANFTTRVNEALGTELEFEEARHA